MTRRQLAGLAILTGVVIVLVAYVLLRDDDSNASNPNQDLEPITVTGYMGNLKVPFLADPEVAAILQERYRITVDGEGSSTQRMLCEVAIDDVDFLWVGDQSQIEIYEQCRNRSDPYRNIFVSPVVVYSWTDTANALTEAGVVRVGSDGVYRLDMVALLALIESGQSWNDLGFENRPSKILVKTTDPNESTSGQHFAALLANSMNCMEVVGASVVDAILPDIHTYFERLGFVPAASAELFRLYLSIGEGQYPLVALYESQIVEFLISNPDDVQQVAADIRMLYPEPTVWITHPVIALTDEGRRFMNALLDPEIQQMAWEKNGFRPSVPGVQIDLSVLPVPGVQERIVSVIDVPAYAVMTRILEAARTDYVPDPNAPPRRDCEPNGAERPATPDPAPASPAARGSANTVALVDRRARARYPGLRALY